MGNMDQVTQQNAAMVEESTAAARSLLQEADGLTNHVGRFSCNSVGSKGQSFPAAAIAAPVYRPRPAPTPVSSGNLAISMPDVDDDWSEF